MYDVVLIEVRGGIAEVVLHPIGVQVIIRDYDCDSVDEVEVDENGDAYVETST